MIFENFRSTLKTGFPVLSPKLSLPRAQRPRGAGPRLRHALQLSEVVRNHPDVVRSEYIGHRRSLETYLWIYRRPSKNRKQGFILKSTGFIYINFEIIYIYICTNFRAEGAKKFFGSFLEKFIAPRLVSELASEGATILTISGPKVRAQNGRQHGR